MADIHRCTVLTNVYEAPVSACFDDTTPTAMLKVMHTFSRDVAIYSRSGDLIMRVPPMGGTGDYVRTCRLNSMYIGRTITPHTRTRNRSPPVVTDTPVVYTHIEYSQLAGKILYLKELDVQVCFADSGYFVQNYEEYREAKLSNPRGDTDIQSFALYHNSENLMRARRQRVFAHNGTGVITLIPCIRDAELPSDEIVIAATVVFPPGEFEKEPSIRVERCHLKWAELHADEDGGVIEFANGHVQVSLSYSALSGYIRRRYPNVNLFAAVADEESRVDPGYVSAAVSERVGLLASKWKDEYETLTKIYKETTRVNNEMTQRLKELELSNKNGMHRYKLIGMRLGAIGTALTVLKGPISWAFRMLRSHSPKIATLLCLL